MTVLTSKELVQRFYEEWFPAADGDALASCIREDYVNHSSPRGLPDGRENALALAEMLARAFEDQRYELHHVLEDGDLVAVHCTWHATHVGEFLGIPPTGRRIAAEQAHLLRVDDGALAEHWAVRDDLTMLRHMGIAPG